MFIRSFLFIALYLIPQQLLASQVYSDFDFNRLYSLNISCHSPEFQLKREIFYLKMYLMQQEYNENRGKLLQESMTHKMLYKKFPNNPQICYQHMMTEYKILEFFRAASVAKFIVRSSKQGTIVFDIDHMNQAEKILYEWRISQTYIKS